MYMYSAYYVCQKTRWQLDPVNVLAFILHGNIITKEQILYYKKYIEQLIEHEVTFNVAKFSQKWTNIIFFKFLSPFSQPSAITQ